jgi:hypothetical protein
MMKSNVEQRRLADEYDAAKERGEVASRGGERSGKEHSPAATVADVGLTRKEIHEARIIRDAEAAQPGIVRQTLDEAQADVLEIEACARLQLPDEYDDGDWPPQSWISFAASYAGMVDGLPGDALAVVAKSMTDGEAGLIPFLRRSERNRALSEMSLSDGGVSPEKIAAVYKSYLAGPWLRERDVGPASTTSAQRRLLFRIAHFGGGASLSGRQIRRILSRQK